MEREPDGRDVPGWVIGLGIAALLAVAGYFALGMPGMDHSAEEMPGDPAGEEHDMDMTDEP